MQQITQVLNKFLKIENRTFKQKTGHCSGENKTFGLIGCVVVRVDIDISRNINTWLDIETLTPCIVLRKYLNLMLGIEELKKNCSRVYPIYVV